MILTTVWLSMAGFIVIAIMRVTDPLLPVVALEFDITIGSAGVIVTAFALPYGLFQLVYGPWGDRIGKLKVIVCMLAVSSLFTCASAFSPGIEALAVMRFMTGLTTAAVVPLSLAYIADNVPYVGRQATIARYLTGLIFGQMIGGSLGGIFGEFLGWRGIFLLFGVVTGLIALRLWRVARLRSEPPGPAAGRGLHFFKPYLLLLQEPASRAVLIAVTIEGLFLLGGSTFIGAYLHVRFGLNFAYVGLVLAGFGLGGLIYSSAVARIVDALGERGMVIWGSLIVGCCYLGLAVTQTWVWCVPLLIAIGLGFMMMHNTLQTLATELAPRARGTALALFAFSLFAGQGIGVALFGRVIDDVGYSLAFGIVGVGAALLGLWFQGRIAQGNA